MGIYFRGHYSLKRVGRFSRGKRRLTFLEPPKWHFPVETGKPIKSAIFCSRRVSSLSSTSSSETASCSLPTSAFLVKSISAYVTIRSMNQSRRHQSYRDQQRAPQEMRESSMYGIIVTNINNSVMYVVSYIISYNGFSWHAQFFPGHLPFRITHLFPDGLVFLH